MNLKNQLVRIRNLDKNMLIFDLLNPICENLKTGLDGEYL